MIKLHFTAFLTLSPMKGKSTTQRKLHFIDRCFLFDIVVQAEQRNC